MTIHTFYSKNLKFVIQENPFIILEISDTLTGKLYCRNGVQSVTVRSPLHISDPSVLHQLKQFKASGDEITFVLGDDSGETTCSVTLSDSPYGLKFKASVEAAEIVWLCEWKLTGFMFDQVIVPALGGQSLSDKMTPETTLSYKYPFWWNAQFVFGEIENDGLAFSFRDPEPNMKLLRVRRDEDDFHLVMGFENPAPLNSKSSEAEWYLTSYSKSWKNAVDDYRAWLENNFQLVPVSENPHLPGWCKNIDFVLELWGMRKDRPEPHHTFDQMIERIKEWAGLHSPSSTLLYIPGFAENGIDSHAPDYNASGKCGGEEKLKELINTAHEMGYHVMLHTNVLALTFDHRMYNEFKKFRVVDPFNHTIGWGMDIDGDWLPEEYFAYMNPGYTEWGDYMENVLGELVKKFNTDAIFLDQTLLAFNVSSGPNFLTGMRNHITRMQKAFPGILFAGEGLNEQVLPALPFVQVHGIDSLSEVHGMEGKKSWRNVHPVSSYLFGKYTRFTAHLLTKYPAHKMFKLQENAYNALNVIPSLCLYDYKQKMDIPEVRKMIKRAKKLKRIFREQEKKYLTEVYENN